VLQGRLAVNMPSRRRAEGGRVFNGVGKFGMAGEQYLVLARKWRPQAFEEVVGQEHITRTLQNAIASGRIGHAFLFIGSRGIGKTTTARILAKALNCNEADSPTPNPCGECENCTSIARGTNIDVVEIDGASNNSVEDVRQIRENIQLVPSNSRYKIYIIDEVHQLSPGAFNALLKTLEEPPQHAIFVLATTEAHKVPATIISRCQRYDFRRVGLDSIRELLVKILDAESITYTDEALYAIARAADGGIRDSESILEQVISYSGDKVTYEDVYEVLGLVEWHLLHKLCDAMIAKDIATQLQIIEDVVVGGKDLPQFIEEILGYYRNLLVCKTADGATLLALPPDELKEMQARADQFTLTELIRLVEQFSELFKRDFDQQLAPRIALEALLIRCSKVAVEVSVDTILEKLAHLGAGGVTTAPEGAPPDPPKPLPATRSQGRAEEKTAEPARLEVTHSNLGEVWTALEEKAGVSLRLLLAKCTPRSVDGDSIIVEISSANADIMHKIQSDDVQNKLLSFLNEITSNIKSIRCELIEDESKENGRNQPGQPSETVTKKQSDDVLQDPTVAHVMDIFKGEIIQVRPKNPSPNDE